MNNKFKGILNYIIYFFQFLHYKLKKFLHYLKKISLYERILVIGVIIILILLLLLPILTFSPNTSTDGKSYIFLFSFLYLKSFVLIVTSLCAILLIFLHKKTQLFIIDKLGFQGNKYILSFLLGVIGLASFISIGETIHIIANFTSSLERTSIYYTIQILYILLIAYSLFMVFSNHEGKFKGRIVGYHTKTSSKKDADGSHSTNGLFDAVQHHHDE